MTAFGMMMMHSARTSWPYTASKTSFNDEIISRYNMIQIVSSGITFLTLSWLSDVFNPKYVSCSS